ncbi:MAG: chemotaxis protein CheW [Syntrophomonadaceae bacterium]|nr:chemotaxis protein CheW [Syntrophomonadaceae bacterium]
MDIEQDRFVDQEVQLVTFELGREIYALDILVVQEIERLLNITRVPKAFSFIEGVINLRGNVIPVINLHKLFDLPARVNTDRTRIIIVKVQDITAGIVVDSVWEVQRLYLSDIEPPSSVVTTMKTQYIQGIGKKEGQLLILLDIAQVLGIEGFK